MADLSVSVSLDKQTEDYLTRTVMLLLVGIAALLLFNFYVRKK